MSVIQEVYKDLTNQSLHNGQNFRFITTSISRLTKLSYPEEIHNTLKRSKERILHVTTHQPSFMYIVFSNISLRYLV